VSTDGGRARWIVRPALTDSVEKLISQAHVILQANATVAENPQ
jgi:hypothetical protein